MSLDKFHENGHDYFQICIKCPACLESGKASPSSFLIHHNNNCSGEMYVGDDAYYKCKKCGQSSHVGNWLYNCPLDDCPFHSPYKLGNYALVETNHPSIDSLRQNISIAAQLVMECGQEWLMEFMKNLAEWQ